MYVFPRYSILVIQSTSVFDSSHDRIMIYMNMDFKRMQILLRTTVQLFVRLSSPVLE